MNLALWIAAGVLAVAFSASGLLKLTRSKEQLSRTMGWVEDFPAPAIRLIGLAELLGAVGLIVPAITGIAPVLVPLAATGLGITMAGALVTHVRRREWRNAAVNVVLLLLAVFVAWGRFGAYAF